MINGSGHCSELELSLNVELVLFRILYIPYTPSIRAREYATVFSKTINVESVLQAFIQEPRACHHVSYMCVGTDQWPAHRNLLGSGEEASI